MPETEQRSSVPHRSNGSAVRFQRKSEVTMARVNLPAESWDLGLKICLGFTSDKNIDCYQSHPYVRNSEGCHSVRSLRNDFLSFVCWDEEEEAGVERTESPLNSESSSLDQVQYGDSVQTGWHQ